MTAVAPSRSRREDRTDSRGRLAVIGDVGGHLDELRAEISRLGGNLDTARLPEDLTVIQLGDLVHRGPASAAVIALVDRFLTNQPGRWIQLVGNHEAHYLRKPRFDWPEHIGDDAVDVLRRWWSIGQMQAAAAVVTESESFLMTHAGLTADFWRRALGAPMSAPEAAAAINALIGAREDVLFRPGQMLTGKRDRGAGPVWAATGSELVPGWVETAMPFSQVHGHASIFDWDHGTYLASAEVVDRTRLIQEARHEIVSVNGGRIIGIDPGHGSQACQPWRAWELQL